MVRFFQAGAVVLALVGLFGVAGCGGESPKAKEKSDSKMSDKMDSKMSDKMDSKMSDKMDSKMSDKMDSKMDKGKMNDK